MHVGDYAIVGDFLGVVVKSDNEHYWLKNKEDVVRKFAIGKVHEVVSSNALAALIYKKLEKHALNERGKN